MQDLFVCWLQLRCCLNQNPDWLQFQTKKDASHILMTHAFLHNLLFYSSVSNSNLRKISLTIPASSIRLIPKHFLPASFKDASTWYAFVLSRSDMLPPLKSQILKWALLAQWLYWAKYLQAILACPAILLPGYGHFVLFLLIVRIRTLYAVSILLASSRMLIAAFRSLSISFPHVQR